MTRQAPAPRLAADQWPRGAAGTSPHLRRSALGEAHGSSPSPAPRGLGNAPGGRVVLYARRPVPLEVDGREIQAGPGTLVHAPRGKAHIFQNIGQTPGRLLVTVQPAGLDVFLADLGRRDRWHERGRFEGRRPHLREAWPRTPRSSPGCTQTEVNVLRHITGYARWWQGRLPLRSRGSPLRHKPTRDLLGARLARTRLASPDIGGEKSEAWARPWRVALYFPPLVLLERGRLVLTFNQPLAMLLAVSRA